VSEPDWVPLLTLEHEEGTAAVFRDARGRHWLSSTSEGGTGLEGCEPALEGLGDAVVIVGGVLPPGAERVRCRDARGEMVPGVAGNGAWLARFEDHDMFTSIAVAFEDAEGRLVPRPPPEGAVREPIADVAAECPACGAADWERVSWTHRWEDEGMDEERSAVRCARCGHAEDEGTTVGSVAILESDDEDADEQPVPAIPPEWLERQRRDALDAFTKAEFPVYALSAWDGPRSFVGWSSDSRRVTAMTVHHGPSGPGPHVDVETMSRDEEWQSDRELALERLSEQLTDEVPGLPPVDASSGAVALWFAARQREGSERAARAETRTVSVEVDGRRVDFQLVSEGDAWAAVGRVERGAVVLSARGVDPSAIALVRIEDPEPYVSGST
jgi:Zn ribbon nucleic-acid-binding protein